MHVFYIFLITALLFIPQNANAVEPLPELLQGYWAAPDCASPDDTIYQSQTHVLHLNEDYAKLEPAHLNKTNSDYFVIQNADKVFPVHIYNDGIMSVGVLAKNHKLDDRMNWDELPLDGIRQYTRCTQAPNSPHDIAPRAMQTIDTLEFYCRYGTEEGCLKEMIKTLDEDGTYKINNEEAVKAALLSIYIAPLLDYTKVNHADVMENMEYAFDQSKLYMMGIFKLIDADLSGELSYNELDHANSVALPELQEKAPNDAISKIMSLYPLLQPPHLYR